MICSFFVNVFDKTSRAEKFNYVHLSNKMSHLSSHIHTWLWLDLHLPTGRPTAPVYGDIWEYIFCPSSWDASYKVGSTQRPRSRFYKNLDQNRLSSTCCFYQLEESSEGSLRNFLGHRASIPFFWLYCVFLCFQKLKLPSWFTG